MVLQRLPEIDLKPPLTLVLLGFVPLDCTHFVPLEVCLGNVLHLVLVDRACWVGSHHLSSNLLVHQQERDPLLLVSVLATELSQGSSYKKGHFLAFADPEKVMHPVEGKGIVVGLDSSLPELMVPLLLRMPFAHWGCSVDPMPRLCESHDCASDMVVEAP